ncbi:hypothetical protein Acr_00g0000970 [Actinidia rufa]|uniref:DUF7746 domain-containing protein n=1 Tax=Actinidia rufa TaxID=165716 RepID=A0A7J0D742_9ERIC|nr:hypothetical protein Acr_00g0000970 [Actinidia rufa]
MSAEGEDEVGLSLRKRLGRVRSILQRQGFLRKTRLLTLLVFTTGISQKVKPSSVLIPIDWAVKFDENRPKGLTPQASNNSDHIKSLDDGVVRLTLRSRRPDEDQGRMVKASVNSLVNLSGDYESREVVKNSASTSKVKEDTDFSSPVGSRICAGVQIVTGIPYSSRQIGAIDSVGAQHNEEGAEDEIEPDRRISTMKTCELSSEEESVSEDTSTSSNEDYRHISMAKKYFERPPPIDLAFGDPIKAHDGFNDQSIYPWSIDGLHPEQINRMLGMMIAASNAYLHGKNEAETAYRLITEGFLGTLINWWDHLPKEAKAEIEASVRIDLSPGQPARDSEGQLIPNPVDSLLATIRTHFCGPLESDEKKHRAALMSLRIKSLDEYKWYKDVFLERVFYMPDCNRAVWKDKFLAGLPNGLGDLVRSRLKEDDLDLMTFGELFAAVDQLLIERCTQKKVENAEKKALSFGKNICWQFGIEPEKEWKPSKSYRRSKYRRKQYKEQHEKWLKEN